MDIIITSPIHLNKSSDWEGVGSKEMINIDIKDILKAMTAQKSKLSSKIIAAPTILAFAFLFCWCFVPGEDTTKNIFQYIFLTSLILLLVSILISSTIEKRERKKQLYISKIAEINEEIKREHENRRIRKEKKRQIRDDKIARVQRGPGKIE